MLKNQMLLIQSRTEFYMLFGVTVLYFNDKWSPLFLQNYIFRALYNFVSSRIAGICFRQFSPSWKQRTHDIRVSNHWGNGWTCRDIKNIYLASFKTPTTHVIRFGETPTTHVIRFGWTPMTHIIWKLSAPTTHRKIYRLPSSPPRYFFWNSLDALLQFCLKFEPWKLPKATRHPMICDVINDVKLFLTVYHRIYCRNFFMLSNQTSHYKIRFRSVAVFLESTLIANNANPDQTAQMYLTFTICYTNSNS